MVNLKEVKIPKGVRENIKGVKDLKSNDFFKLPKDVQIDILNDGVDEFRTYIETRKLTPKLSDYMQLFEDIYHETGDPNVTPYLQLFDAMKSRSGSKLSRDVFETLRNDDPVTFDVYSKYPGEEVANIPGFDFYEYKRTGNGVIESAEPTTGVLTSNPINNASSAEAASGALTNPSLKLPEAGNQFELPNVGKTVEEAAASAYKGNEPPIADYDTPIMSPGVHVGFDEKPTNITPEGITVSKPNSASPSPEAIGEAMRDAIKDRVGDTQLNKEDTPAFLTKEGKVKAAEDATKAEAKTETAPDKTESKTTPETPETPQGLFSRLGGHIGRNLGKYLGGAGLGTLGYAVIRDLASDNSTLKSLFNDIDYDIPIPNTPPVTQPRNEPATNEEYVPGKIPSYIPQDNLPSIKESTASKKVKSQPQVVNAPAPVNNATADYVRAAYNSYVPSDAGRAYQKAIYGDPLELERNRQQQKWRDFVMRSGQSPAELVQRGLMPYDALQYV